MKRRIAVFTGTRAEYGLLYWLLKEIEATDDLQLQLLVSGMHLSPEYGQTASEIEADGFEISSRVEMLLSSDTAVGVVKSMGLGTVGFADALDRLRPDLLVVLGDRFEALAVAQAALVMRIPIAHLHAGEATEGAYDDSIRHAITKMSNMHFTAAEPYRRRVIQMGEDPERVFNVGALGLDHLSRGTRMSVKELAADLGFDLSAPYFLVTYHPVTGADEDPGEVARAMLVALDRLREHRLLITYPNADNGGRKIISVLEEFARDRPQRVHAIPSLGSRRYLSALSHAEATIGNSSSGIIEAPAFGVPAVNIGARQRGRLAAASVIHSRADTESIHAAVQAAISPAFRKSCQNVVNPYGQGNAAAEIVRILRSQPFGAQKRFHDLENR